MRRTYDPKNIKVTFMGRELTGFESYELHYEPCAPITVGSEANLALTGRVENLIITSGGFVFEDTLVRKMREDFYEQWPEVKAYALAFFGFHGKPVTHYPARGGGLIPDEVFERRYGRNRPTTERTHAPENEDDRDRERLVPGCYHRRSIRYDDPRGSDE